MIFHSNETWFFPLVFLSIKILIHPGIEMSIAIKRNTATIPMKTASIPRIALPIARGLLKINQRTIATAARKMERNIATHRMLQVVLQKYEQNVAFRDSQ